jgi:hypothetical protein
MTTGAEPGDPAWDLAWTPASSGWLESVDDGDAWVVNHPPGVNVGDAAACWSAHVTELRPRPVLTSPDDGYCRQCLEITAATVLVRCSYCGHATHPSCVDAHQAAHAEFSRGAGYDG